MVPTSSPSVCYVVDTGKPIYCAGFCQRVGGGGSSQSENRNPGLGWRSEVTPGTLTDASIRVRIKTASLEVLDEMRDSDRRELLRVMNGEVLETQRFPEVIFESSEARAERQKDDLYRLKVQGRLDLHGVVSDHSFVAQVALGVDSARAYGEFKLQQTDYGIRIASSPGAR